MKFHEEISPTSFVRLKEAPLQKTPDGRVIGLFPLDYVPWTSDLEVIIGTMSENIDQMSDVTSKELALGRVEGTEAAAGNDPIRTLMRLTPIKMTTDLVFHVRIFCSITLFHWGELRGPLREIVSIFRPPFEDHGL